ncbi:NADH-ubiquinone reductase complex 1 MLRQ subunit [Tripterygium wilfordii]|uniref:NADH-ubiquinone reductase complex 1 MLRQ subunit n=1 Tax=Tripterygium wilfordii TaxID=458696 RepID=A0A7J7DJ30_TRIWF|nr:uncharacterized protein LOC120000269 [Tripterygium wilfordii]KAF5746362.1 NADH-ubiquinone reductase complex 1 MLRQ subunit [Tripterygium wilfordii]
MAASLGGTRSFASSTAPKMKHFTPSAAADAATHAGHHYNKFAIIGEFAPVYVVLGMVVVALSIGGHTAKQQLVNSPSVHVSKKRRGSFPEAADPERSLAKADKFVNKSFLRKVGHIQERNPVLADTSRPDPFTRPRNAETLKSVGVEPGRN